MFHLVLCSTNNGFVQKEQVIDANNLVGLCNYVNMRRKQINRGYKVNYVTEISFLNNNACEKAWHFVDRLLKTCKEDTIILYLREQNGIPKPFFSLSVQPQHVFRILPNGVKTEISNNVNELPKASDVVKKEYTPYLQTLGLKEGVTVEEVKKAYKKLALLYHPDKTKNCPLKKQLFVQITSAYQVIIN